MALAGISAGISRLWTIKKASSQPLGSGTAAQVLEETRFYVLVRQAKLCLMEWRCR